jgi:hypothetical protein
MSEVREMMIIMMMELGLLRSYLRSQLVWLIKYSIIWLRS